MFGYRFRLHAPRGPSRPLGPRSGGGSGRAPAGPAGGGGRLRSLPGADSQLPGLELGRECRRVLCAVSIPLGLFTTTPKTGPPVRRRRRGGRSAARTRESSHRPPSPRSGPARRETRRIESNHGRRPPYAQLNFMYKPTTESDEMPIGGPVV